MVNSYAPPYRFTSPLGSAVRLFSAHPLYFLALMAPELLTDVLGIFITPWLQRSTFWRALPFFFPYLALSGILSAFCTAAVFLAARGFLEHGEVSLAELWQTLRARAPHLLSAGALIGITYGIGMIAYILPGLILIGLYLFVPHLIICEGGQPTMVYLNRSWKLASRHRTYTLLLVLAMLAVSSVSFILDGLLPARAGISATASLGLRLLVSLFLSCMMEAWVAVYFLRIQSEDGTR